MWSTPEACIIMHHYNYNYSPLLGGCYDYDNTINALTIGLLYCPAQTAK